MRWFFYKEEEVKNNIAIPYFITEIQPTNEELLKPHVSSNIEILYKEKHKTIIKIKADTKEVLVEYKQVPPTPKEEFSVVKETTVINDLDINEIIYPYILDIDYQISEIKIQLNEVVKPNIIKQFRLIEKMGGFIMTYIVLKKEIRRGALTLLEANKMIEVFLEDRKITKEQADECKALAEIYCEVR